ncbi:MAG: hypothetical protein ACLPWF_23375 [Bryobacteraceae bacterium]
MNKRAITFLLAALLALAANANVPVARARTNGSGSAIVWIAQDRAEERLLVRPRPLAAPPAVELNYQAPTNARYFATSLYQRPPPSLR